MIQNIFTFCVVLFSADDLADEMEDVDLDEEEAAWKTEEEDEGVEEGMEAQDDSEVTFSKHTGGLSQLSGFLSKSSSLPPWQQFMNSFPLWESESIVHDLCNPMLGFWLDNCRGDNSLCLP